MRFDDIVNGVLSFLRGRRPAYADFARSDFTMALIEAFAYVFDNLNFQLEIAKRESFLSTAQFEKSIVRIARQIGYRRRGAIPLTVVAQPSNFQNGSIGEVSYLKFSIGNYAFYNFLDKGDFYYALNQGNTELTIGTEDFHVFEVETGGKPADGFVYGIDVNGNLWTEMTEFSDFSVPVGERRYFVVDYYPNKIVLTFGSGSFVAKPPSGRFQLYYHTVSDVNLYDLRDSIGEDKIIKSVVSLPREVEDVENVRMNAVNSFFSLGRIISESDLIGYVKRKYPDYKIKTLKMIDYGKTSLGKVFADFENVVASYPEVQAEYEKFKRNIVWALNLYEFSPAIGLYAVKSDGKVLLSEEKQNLEKEINRIIPIGSRVFVISDDSYLIKVNLSYTLTSKFGFSDEIVNAGVVSAISDYFKSLGYGDKFILSDLVAYVYGAVSGVDDFSIINVSFETDGNYGVVRAGNVVIGYKPNDGYAFVLNNSIRVVV